MEPDPTNNVVGYAGFENPLMSPTFTYMHDGDGSGGANAPVRTNIFEVIAGADGAFEISLTADAASAVAGTDATSGPTLELADSYSFSVRLIIDAEPGVDGDDVDPTTFRGTHNANNNDADHTFTANVDINVMRVDENGLLFDVVPAKAVKGSVVSSVRKPINSDPQEWDVTGIGSSAKLIDIAVLGGQVEDFEIKEYPAGSGNFRLFVKESGVDSITGDADNGQPHDSPLPISVVLMYDEDTAVDSSATPDDNSANDNDVQITLTGSVNTRDALAFSGTLGEVNPDSDDTDGMPNTDGIHYAFTIPQSVQANTPIGYFVVTGGITEGAGADGDLAETDDNIAAEYLDGIISGDSSGLFEVRDTDMTLVYNGSDSLEVGTYELDLTVSGDAGMANRTIIGKAMVTVTASNEAPSAPGTFAATVDENEPSEEVEASAGPPAVEAVPGLVKPGTEVGDASTGVDAGDGDSLTYSLSGAGASVFTINSSTGVISVGTAGISDSDGGPTDADADAKYTRDDNGALADDTDKYSNISYTFKIKVSDGISANDQYIDATVTVDVNDPTEVVGDADLPSGVMAATLMIDDDGDPATDDVEVDGYQINVNVPERDVPMTVVNLGDMVNDADSDDLDFDVSGAPSHLVFDSATDNLLLTYLPPEADPGPRVDTITVGVSDKFNEEDTNDQTIYIEISVTEEPPAPIESEFVSITVAENSMDCSQDGVASGCSLAGEVPTATSFSIESGVQHGQLDDNGDVVLDANGDVVPAYAVDPATGVITVLQAQNYEDGRNPAFLVNANNAEGLAGLISVRVSITDEPEAPALPEIAGVPWVYETAQIGDPVVEKPPLQDGPADTDLPVVLTASDEDAGAVLTYSISAGKAPFAINSSTGALTVSGALDKETNGTHTFTVKVTDEDNLSDELVVTVHVLNSNETPNFTSPAGDDAVTTISESMSYSDGAILFGVNGDISVFNATDEDEDDLTFELREGLSRDQFQIANITKNGPGDFQAELRVKQDVELDYEAEDYDPDNGMRVHVEVQDPAGLADTLLLVVKLINENDNAPIFDGSPPGNVSVEENMPRGHVLGNYSASDADGDTVTYSLGTGGNNKSFHIDENGDLKTLESLDYDNAGTPCGTDHQCVVNVVASDGTHSDSMEVTVTITSDEDSVSTFDVTKANPVPGTTMGNPYSALSNTKSTYSAAVPESPADLPVSSGDAPENFVDTDWANWGTVLRIAVTSESPDPNCGNGNQCVVIDVNSDSADDELKLIAYRSGDDENQFVAALKLVELSSDATPGDAAVYKHTDGGVAALKVDEEDEVELEYGNARDDIQVENEAPEVSNFAPEHERAFDDADVDYTFTITDAHSGLPEPQDLPDTDGNDEYMPVVALISKSEGGMGQCSVATSQPEGTAGVLSAAAHIHEDDTLYCPGTAQDGEYVASEGGYGFAPIRDDKDFDEIDDGYDVETTIVLTENDTYYVTFIVCDNAGNCAYHDPDGNDDNEELAEITVDTENPDFVEARTGLNWDSTDNEYDDDRSYIQVIFNDLTTLNPATVEVDDFVVEGHTIASVSVYENPDDDDVDWGESGRYAAEGNRNLRYIDRYRDLENAVFIELEDELLADETPDVTIVPNGVEDGAGNEQDDGDHEADDWISPTFTVVSITSALETSQDEILAGDGDEITVVVTSDERLDATRPTVTVTYVNAPAGTVDTKGTASCDNDDGTDGTRDRGEIVLTDECQDINAAAGGKLNNNVEKVSNTEWIVTIVEPDDTGYYSFRIEGVDRSPQENPGSEGISADAIVTDFFDSDGDVNTDDAVFWEADVNLPKPNVRVSGNEITDNEPDIEFRSPLFVEIDFTVNHSDDCDDDPMANCMNENSEYAEDNFDDVVITMFELDGVDMTDSVRTTDGQTFLVTLENVALGDHTARIQAMDVAGNSLEDVLEIDFEVSDRDPFERRLNPGWNLVSLPGEPSDSAIGSVFGSGVEVRTVYTYDPVVPGGWMVAVRETLDSDWQGDLTEITGSRGYWVLSDAIQDWEVSIPRLAGGAAGTGTPIQPPVIALYAGWNLIPVTDISGNGEGGQRVSADVYLQNLDDGLDLARVLGFDTIRNQWVTVLDPDMQMNNTLRIGDAYWIFVREAASLVPSGYVSGGGSD